MQEHKRQQSKRDELEAYASVVGNCNKEIQVKIKRSREFIQFTAPEIMQGIVSPCKLIYYLINSL